MLWSRINNGANSNYHYVTRKNGHLYAGACIWITWHDVCQAFSLNDMSPVTLHASDAFGLDTGITAAQTLNLQ